MSRRRQSPNRSNNTSNNNNGNTNNTNNNANRGPQPLNNNGSNVAKRPNTQNNNPRPNAWSKGAPHIQSQNQSNQNQNKQNRNGQSNSPNNPSNINSTNSSNTNTANNEDSPRWHMHDRMGFLLAKAVGSVVTATVTSGAQYQGVLVGANADGDLGIALKFVEKIASAEGEDEEDDKSDGGTRFEQLLILPKDLADIDLGKLDLSAEKLDSSVAKETKGFKTDTDISSTNSKSESFARELTPWQPDEDDIQTSLEDLENTHDSNWDQFAVNEQKFGVQSTYDERYYTTSIDRAMPNYDQIEKKADKLAKEIMNEGASSVHVAEERGLKVDDSGMDEEDKYSGVDRTNNNKYKPPQLRQQNKKLPQDPAIISSSLRKQPASSASPSSASSNATTNKKDDRQHIENKLAGDLRQFVNQEQERVQQKRLHYHKKEMTEQLEGLKQFSASYKITAPVPDDLIPILSKSKEKQDQIKHRALSSPSSEKSEKSEKVEKVEKGGNAQKSSTTTTTTSKTDKVGKQKPKEVNKAEEKKEDKKTTPPKFNFNAAEFKPNPSAHSFTPKNISNTTSPRQKTSTPNTLSPSVNQASMTNSPHPTHNTNANTNTRRQPTPAMIWGNKVEQTGKSRKGLFNPLLRSKQKYSEQEKLHKQDPANNPPPPMYVIERAYVTGPAWPTNENEPEKSWRQEFEENHGAGKMSPRGMGHPATAVPTSANANPAAFNAAAMNAAAATNFGAIPTNPVALNAMGGFPAGSIPVVPPNFAEIDPRMMGSPPPPPMPGQMPQMMPQFMPMQQGYPQQYQYYQPQQQVQNQNRNGSNNGQQQQQPFVPPQMMGQFAPAGYATGSPHGTPQMVSTPPMYYQQQQQASNQNQSSNQSSRASTNQGFRSGNNSSPANS